VSTLRRVCSACQVPSPSYTWDCRSMSCSTNPQGDGQQLMRHWVQLMTEGWTGRCTAGSRATDSSAGGVHIKCPLGHTSQGQAEQQ
jgi:hypothetical protein